MSSTLEHFSHPRHPLILKENEFKMEGAVCYVCGRTIIDSLIYTCTSRDINIDCENFYLHKSCSELPRKIRHHKHSHHTLSLELRVRCICDVCGRVTKSHDYSCVSKDPCDCDFDVCIICSFQERVLNHEAHPDHSLTLMQRVALFECDACGKEAKDTSYICTTCDFWIHSECAFVAPVIILTTEYHGHSLDLLHSLPIEHRPNIHFCGICHSRVFNSHWVYYCHKCTYFVHVRCAANNEIKAYDNVRTFDTVRFPLLSEESLLELIRGICGKHQIDFQSDDEKNITYSTIYNDPHIIEEHWSHDHPLEKFQFTDASEYDNDDYSDGRRVLICDGCIQPITTSDPSYYACVQCAFFLHSLCATKLPRELPAGASTFHPKYPLFLGKSKKFSSFVKCGVCSFLTNGFYYSCKGCDFKVDMRCAFLPTRIQHKSHKQHFLVPRPPSKYICSASTLPISEGMEYACETCNEFQIHILSAFYPDKINHRYDLHPLTLRHPPFYHEEALHCEICEEQVDKQSWLYHCGVCDYSYHCDCVRQYENVKLGGTVKLSINDENHTLALVLKRPQGKTSPLYICCYCGQQIYRGEISPCVKSEFFFECDGCGFLACCKCVDEILRE